jgi:hypothetical protein
VTSQRPQTFDHVFEEAAAEPKRKARWPLLVLLIVVAAGGGIAAALALQDHGSAPSASNAERPDAAPAPPARPDAAVVIDVPLDASVPVDAGVAVDAGVRKPGKHDAGTPKGKPDAGVPRDKLTPRGTVAVQVITKPDNATVYVGNSYRGTGNVTIEQDPNTTAKIKCTLPGYDPGYATVKFDGNTEVVMCRPVHTVKCVPGVKNPFDDCPDPDSPPQ